MQLVLQHLLQNKLENDAVHFSEHKSNLSCDKSVAKVAKVAKYSLLSPTTFPKQQQPDLTG